MAENKKAIVYVRVSTQSQDEKGTSLESQQAACLEYAKQQGYEVVKIASDVYSGAYFYERPALARLCEEVRQKRYDAVIIYAVDRLSRKLAHLAMMVDDCERFCTELLFVTDSLDTSPEGALLYSVRGYVAEIEREKIKERTSRGKRVKAENGTLSNKHRVFGYEYNPATDRREIVEAEAEVIRSIFHNYIHCKRAMRGIATQLDLLGIPSPQNGSYWTQSTVKRILQNPVYIGKVYAFRYQKVTRRGKKGKRVTYNIPRPQDAWVLMPNTDITPIISTDEFNAAQTLIEHNRKSRRKEPEIDFLLRGRIICERCNRTYATNRDRGKYRRYNCDSRRSPLTKCGNPGISAEIIEQKVWASVTALFSNPDYLKSQLEQAASSGNGLRQRLEAEAKSVAKSFARAENDLKKLISRMATVEDSVWELVQEQFNIKQEEFKQLKQMKEDADAALKTYVNQTFDVESLVAQSREIGKRINTLDFTDKVKLINGLDTKVKWNGERVVVSFNLIDLQGSRSDDFHR